MDKNIIVTKDLYKSYEGLPIIKNVSLNVKQNSFTVIIGKSGSGKTTLLSLLSGLEKPDSGEVILCNEYIENRPEEQLAQTRRDNIGFVFQAFNLIPTLTAVENVMLPLIPVNIGKAVLKRNALEIMKYIGIDHRNSHIPSKLSGGERQRVAIARALINKPKVLFADEPTGNLDSTTGKEVMDLFMKLQKEQGITIVMVTHDEDYKNNADKVINLKDGEICHE